jgi:hypothetical protein
MLRSLFALAIDADVLQLIADEAIAQDKASTQTDALAVARHEIALLVTRALDIAWSEAIDRHITPRSIEQICAEQELAEVIPHVTAAQLDDTRRVLTEVGQRLREAGQ